MATKKAVKKPVKQATKASSKTEVGAGPLAFGTEAHAARHVRDGLAFSPEQDLAFALGWPFMTVLVDGHPDDVEAEKNALATMMNPTEATMPREVAHRRARFFAAGGEGVHEGRGVPPAAGKAASKAGPLTNDQARKVVTTETSYLGARWWLFVLIEAIHGPEVVVEGVLDGIEKWPVEKWATDHRAVGWLHYLGFPLLRVREDAHRRARERLTKIFERCVKKHFGGTLPALARAQEVSTNIRALDLILHGAEGARRSGSRLERSDGKARIQTFDVLFVHDDPALVRQVIADVELDDDSPFLSARHVFLGGPEVLDLFAQRWQHYGAKEQLEFAAEIATIADERAYAILLTMSATSKAKKPALAALVEHANKTRPFLERAAKGRGDSAEFARAVLAKMR